MMWTPIRLTDRTTGRSVDITILERELFMSGIFDFDDLWNMHQLFDDQLTFDCGVAHA